jgi:hypothetical protein
MNTEKIKSAIKVIWNILNSKVFYVGVILIVFVLYFDQCSKKDDLKREAIKTEQNLEASLDTITTIRTKNGKLNSSISGYVSTENELKRLNTDLYDDLESQNGKVITLSNANIGLEQDKDELNKYISILEKKLGEFEKNKDGTYTADWSLTYRYDSTNFDKFDGYTTVGITQNTLDKDNPFTLKHVNTELTYRKTQIDLTWGTKVENDKLRVFAESKHPAFQVSGLKGILIDPNKNKYIKSLMEKDHWFTGFGVGPNLGLGYDIIHSRTTVVLGVGIQYNIYQW